MELIPSSNLPAIPWQSIEDLNRLRVKFVERFRNERSLSYRVWQLQQGPEESQPSQHQEWQ